MIRLSEAGKRHSADDFKLIQTLHDTSAALGAACDLGNISWPVGMESAREAALPMHQSHDALRDQLRSALMLAHGVTDTYSSRGPYVMDVFPKDVVYNHAGLSYRRSYTQNSSTNPPTVKLGEPVAVHRAYLDVAAKESATGYLHTESVTVTPAQEAEEAKTGLERLTESAQCFEVDPDSADILREGASQATLPLIPVKIIGPGWGNSGYYSADVLKRDGPKLWEAGHHMYIDHATDAERKARPENSVKNLVGVLAEKAAWNDTGFNGPGLYSSIKPFSDHYTTLKEKGKYIGASINAYGKRVDGEAEGKKGKIVTELYASDSVDVVTKPGAGGALLTESQRTHDPGTGRGDDNMTEQEQATLREAQNKLTEAQAQVARLTLESNQAIATAAYISAFRAKGFEITVEAAQTMASNPPLKEGKVDLEAIKKVADGFKGAGKTGRTAVTGMGAEAETRESVKPMVDELNGLLVEGFGLTKEVAESLNRGYLNGD